MKTITLQELITHSTNTNVGKKFVNLTLNSSTNSKPLLMEILNNINIDLPYANLLNILQEIVYKNNINHYNVVYSIDEGDDILGDIIEEAHSLFTTILRTKRV